MRRLVLLSFELFPRCHERPLPEIRVRPVVSPTGMGFGCILNRGMAGAPSCKKTGRGVIGKRPLTNLSAFPASDLAVQESELSQAKHVAALWPRTKMGRNFSHREGLRKICSRCRSPLVLLQRGFGEYYQCGYWAALENRGSRLLAAASRSNPLLSASFRDPRAVKSLSDREWFLTNPSLESTFKVVFKRGSVPFLGGLTSRLSLSSGILPRVVNCA
jgi:hypothetical protein